MIRCPYWTPEFIDQAERAQSFEELGFLSLQVLKSMPSPVCGLSGPMSTGGLGTLEKNLKLFFACTDLLRERGENPFDLRPIETAVPRLKQEWEQKNDGYCFQLLEVTYDMIYRSGYLRRVYMLPGWETSIGACWEYRLACELSLEVKDFPPNLYNEVFH